MKLRLPSGRAVRGLIYIVCILLIALAIDLVLVRLARRVTPGERTTKITSPTLPDGRIDYLTALENRYGEGVTPENNATPLFLAAVGPAGLPKSQPRDGITARLGMPPLPDQGDYFRVRDDADDQAEPLEPLMQRPWKAADRPKTAAWLKANEKPLGLFAEGSKRPRYFIPFNGGTPPEMLFDILLPHLHLFRDCCRALVCRAMLKAGAGDFAGAREDLLTVHRFADLLSARTTTLIDSLVAYAVDELASAAEASIAADGKLDAAEARRWLAMQRSLHPVNEFTDVIDVSERYLFLQVMQYASGHGMYRALHRIDDTMQSVAPMSGVPARPTAAHLWQELIPIRVARVMEQGNQWYDTFAAALRTPAGQARRDAVNAAEEQFKSFASAGEPWRSMSAWGWPNFLKSTDRRDRAIARRNLAIVASALAVYHAEHGGTYPPTLDALKSPDLPQIPGDPFGDTLTYHPAGSGYDLLSVGPDQKAGGGDDITVGTPTARATTAAGTSR